MADSITARQTARNDCQGRLYDSRDRRVNVPSKAQGTRLATHLGTFIPNENIKIRTPHPK